MKQRMFWTALFFILLATGMLVRGAHAQKETELIEPDSQAVEVINGLLGALSLEDDQARWDSLLSVLHPVLLVKNGTDVHQTDDKLAWEAEKRWRHLDGHQL